MEVETRTLPRPPAGHTPGTVAEGVVHVALGARVRGLGSQKLWNKEDSNSIISPEIQSTIHLLHVVLHLAALEVAGVRLVARPHVHQGVAQPLPGVQGVSMYFTTSLSAPNDESFNQNYVFC